MLEQWYELFTHISNKHAPIRTRRVRNKKAPWLTPELRNLIAKRDRLEKKAVKTRDSELWNEFKKQRNKINNLI